MIRILFGLPLVEGASLRTILARWAHGIGFFIAYCGLAAAYMSFLLGGDGTRILVAILISISMVTLGRLIRYFIGGE